MKVFGIGMFKTGTTTLGNALQSLGYHCFNGPWKNVDEFPYDPWNETPEIYVANKKKLIAKVEQYDAFQDYPFMFAYKELDQWFPGSKFILTTRDPQSLAKSDIEMWKRQNLARGDEVPSASKFIQRYENHYSQVRQYFESRTDDLLTVSWFDGDEWTQLCQFLDCPIPSIPFPHANAAGGEVKKSLAHRIAVRIRRLFW